MGVPSLHKESSLQFFLSPNPSEKKFHFLQTLKMVPGYKTLSPCLGISRADNKDKTQSGEGRELWGLLLFAERAPFRFFSEFSASRSTYSFL